MGEVFPPWGTLVSAADGSGAFAALGIADAVSADEDSPGGALLPVEVTGGLDPTALLAEGVWTWAEMPHTQPENTPTSTKLRAQPPNRIRISPPGRNYTM